MVTSSGGHEFITRIGNTLAPRGAVVLWWLGQASFALRMGGATIYIDPYLTESDQRLVPPPCSGDQITNADLIVITHGHSDHLDVGALPLIARASPAATIIAPRPLVSRIAELVGEGSRVVPADAGSAIVWGDLEILPVIASHEEFNQDPRLGYPYLGYVLRDGQVTLYHAGDTIPYQGLVEALAPLRIDLALLPINGRDYFRQQRGIAGNLDAREAAELALLLGVETVMPMHYGMFAGNTAPPGAFVDHLHAIAPHIHAQVPGLHQPWTYYPSQSGKGGKPGTP